MTKNKKDTTRNSGKPLLSKLQDSKLARPLALVAFLVSLAAGGLYWEKTHASDKPVEAVKPVNDIPEVNEVVVVG